MSADNARRLLFGQSKYCVKNHTQHADWPISVFFQQVRRYIETPTPAITCVCKAFLEKLPGKSLKRYNLGLTDRLCRPVRERMVVAGLAPRAGIAINGVCQAERCSRHAARQGSVCPLRVAIGVSVALLIAILVLTKLQSAHPGLAPSDQLAFERQRADRLRALLQNHETVPEDLACPAAKVNDATVQTLYVIWLNTRPDLVTVQDRDAAAADLDQAITACREQPVTLDAESHARGMDVQKAVALAILAAGR